MPLQHARTGQVVGARSPQSPSPPLSNHDHPKCQNRILTVLNPDGSRYLFRTQTALCPSLCCSSNNITTDYLFIGSQAFSQSITANLLGRLITGRFDKLTTLTMITKEITKRAFAVRNKQHMCQRNPHR